MWVSITSDLVRPFLFVIDLLALESFHPEVPNMYVGTRGSDAHHACLASNLEQPHLLAGRLPFDDASCRDEEGRCATSTLRDEVVQRALSANFLGEGTYRRDFDDAFLHAAAAAMVLHSDGVISLLAVLLLHLDLVSSRFAQFVVDVCELWMAIFPS